MNGPNCVSVHDGPIGPSIVLAAVCFSCFFFHPCLWNSGVPAWRFLPTSEGSQSFPKFEKTHTGRTEQELRLLSALLFLELCVRARACVLPPHLAVCCCWLLCRVCLHVRGRGAAGGGRRLPQSQVRVIHSDLCVGKRAAALSGSRCKRGMRSGRRSAPTQRGQLSFSSPEPWPQV